jgi:hypothetical protein
VTIPATGISGTKLRPLRPVLKAWQHLNSAIGSEWAREYEDAPWWYNERASISFLAGAIWKSGGWALEEFSSRKKGFGRGTAAALRAGRYDINFAVGENEYIAEAKQCWPRPHDIKAAGAAIRHSLRQAKADARSDISWDLPVLAIVFAVPRIPISRAPQVSVLLQRLVELPLPNVLVAWSFPLAARALRSPTNGYIYPGVMILVDQVGKGA